MSFAWVILDAGVSMSEISGSSSAFDRARTGAIEFLPYQAGLRADVTVAAARPRALLESVTGNMSVLRAMRCRQLSPYCRKEPTHRPR